jgi:Spy/CpxP family protein refolding chaperone
MMLGRAALLAAGLLIAAGVAAAQHQPYEGLQQRAIKALSDQQLADLQAGSGMSLALAAELNGYPGPRHVLDLAGELQLSADQRTRTEELFAAMRREAIAIGADIIRGESALDRLFATKTASPEVLRDLVTELGRSQGALRLTHLKYHLAMLELLTPEQAARYWVLRGYADGEMPDREMLDGHAGHRH